MDRSKHRTPNAYGGRAQEGVLEVFMSLHASLALRWKLLFRTINIRERDCSTAGICNATWYLMYGFV